MSKDENKNEVEVPVQHVCIGPQCYHPQPGTDHVCIGANCCLPTFNGDIFTSDFGAIPKGVMHEDRMLHVPLVGLLPLVDADLFGIKREPAAPVSFSMGCMVQEPVCALCKEAKK